MHCVCGRTATLQCARCNCTFYCSRRCQRRDWPQHGAACRLLALRCRLDALGIPFCSAKQPSIQYIGQQLPIGNQLELQPVSALDDGTYRLVELANGLRVLLVSDPTVMLAAAALDVAVGSMQDPPSTPGLSHFCEHLLFLGTRTHPAASEYNDFVSEHGGTTNAFTALEATNFQLEVLPRVLGEALQRFSEFFAEPLLDAKFAARELDAVDAEHVKNVPIEARRLHRLITSLCEGTLSNFSTGSHQTLRADAATLQLARAHVERYYQNAATMRLCVVGTQSLDELAALVASSFGRLRGTRVGGWVDPSDALLDATKLPQWSSPWAPAKRQILVRVEAASVAGRLLVLVFAMPPYNHEATGVLALLQEAVERRHQDGLLATLQDRGLASALQCLHDGATRTNLLFSVHATLTRDGLKAVGTIVSLFFAFVDALRQTLADERSPFAERSVQAYARSVEQRERFRASDDPVDRAISLSSNLRQYGPAVLRRQLLPPNAASSYATAASQLLSYVRPDNAQVYVVASWPANQTRQWQQEQYFGVRYALEPLAVAPSNDAFDVLVAANPYPLSAVIWSKPSETEDSDSEPDEHTAGSAEYNRLMGRGERPYPRLAGPHLWFKHDAYYGVPRANVRVLLRPAITPVVDSQLATLVASGMLQRRLAGRDAARANLELAVRHTDAGLELSADAFIDNSNVLEQALADVRNVLLSTDAVPSNLVALAADALAQLYEQQQHGETYMVARRTVERMLRPGGEPPHALAAALEAPLSELVTRVAVVWRQWSAASVTCLVHGRVTEAQAQSLARLFEQNGRAGGSAATGGRLVALEQHVRLQVPLPSATKSSEQHALATLLQCGLATPRAAASLALLSASLEQPLYDELRLRQQLGYIVSTQQYVERGIAHLAIMLQSARFPASVLEQRLDAALLGFVAGLGQTRDEFERQRRSLLARQYSRPASLELATASLWSEICRCGPAVGLKEHPMQLGHRSERILDDWKEWRQRCWPLFERRFFMVEALATLTFDAYSRFVHETLDPAGQKRASVHVDTGTGAVDPKMLAEADIACFQSTSYLFPTIVV